MQHAGPRFFGKDAPLDEWDAMETGTDASASPLCYARKSMHASDPERKTKDPVVHRPRGPAGPRLEDPVEQKYGAGESACMRKKASQGDREAGRQEKLKEKNCKLRGARNECGVVAAGSDAEEREKRKEKEGDENEDGEKRIKEDQRGSKRGTDEDSFVLVFSSLFSRRRVSNCLHLQVHMWREQRGKERERK